MHGYIITRGVKHEVDRMINELSAKYLPYKFEGKKKFVQMGVRPMQIWELVFPEDQLNTIMWTLWKTKPSQDSNKIAIMSAGLRKVLGAKPYPEIEWPDEKKRIILPVHNEFIGILPIGIRKDHYKDGTEIL